MALRDVPSEYERELQRLREKHYQNALRPYLEKALRDIKGSPGVAGRSIQRLRATERAQEALFHVTGHRPP